MPVIKLSSWLLKVRKLVILVVYMHVFIIRFNLERALEGQTLYDGQRTSKCSFYCFIIQMKETVICIWCCFVLSHNDMGCMLYSLFFSLSLSHTHSFSLGFHSNCQHWAFPYVLSEWNLKMVLKNIAAGWGLASSGVSSLSSLVDSLRLSVLQRFIWYLTKNTKRHHWFIISNLLWF